MATEDMWNDGGGKMGWMSGGELGKYRQVTTNNLRVYCPPDNLGLGTTTDLQGDSGCIWRL